HRELARGEARQRADAPRQLAPGLPEIDEEEQRRGDRSGGQPARHTSGNAAQSSATVRRVSARAAASSPASRARAIAPPLVSISAGPMPRVVTAGVPMRIPEATIGGRVSNGIVFLLTVIPTDSSVFSASRPETPRAPTSTIMTWLSVPPETSRKPRLVSAEASSLALPTTPLW